MSHHIRAEPDPAARLTELGAASEQGTVRSENQDAVAVCTLAGGEALLVLADGMGGHPDGRLAASLAVEAVVQHVSARSEEVAADPVAVLRGAVGAANDAVAAHRRPDAQGRSLGTTLVAALLGEDGAVVANVGDSRAYRLHRGAALQVTADHSAVAEQVRAGLLDPAAAEHHPARHRITRAVMGVAVEIDIFTVALGAGDGLLLCSDGVWEPLGGEGIAAAAAGAAGLAAPRSAARICAAALEAGSRDNASVVLARRSR